MSKITVEQIDEVVRLTVEGNDARYRLQTGEPKKHSYNIVVLPKDRLIEAAEVLGVEVTKRFLEDTTIDFFEIYFMYKGVKFFDQYNAEEEQ